MDPSSAIAYSDLPLTGSEHLDHDDHRQFWEPGGPSSFPIFDAAAGLQTVAHRSLRSSAEGFFSEFSSYGAPAVPAVFYDQTAASPVVAMNLSLDGGFNHGPFLGGMEVRRPKMESKKKKSKAGDLYEDFGTQKNEKQRRQRFNDKFEILKSLIPNSTKPDKASILSDTIDYIKELSRTVQELRLLVAKKRSKIERGIKPENDDELHGEMDSSSISKPSTTTYVESDHGLNGAMRSSRVQRRSKGTFVDVRIVEDEVYIKLAQRRRVGCPLIVSRVLDELQLEPMHLTGGNIGDILIYMKAHQCMQVQWLGGSLKLWRISDFCAASLDIILAIQFNADLCPHQYTMQCPTEGNSAFFYRACTISEENSGMDGDSLVMPPLPSHRNFFVSISRLPLVASNSSGVGGPKLSRVMCPTSA
ncbi:Transcription factor bHLH10 [Apostasia shenzhenica]|uniref:Transcription factor bHLH10 n=1 Tax=Apostasia shenzhenica TaxID=1088818 RepID=A0A2I0BD16_9ASPA|nr:Transcription factor bHLH10 [Apostasia shenzhenica]